LGAYVNRVEAIAADLQRLRRGRGVHSPDVLSRLGVTLQSVVFGDIDPSPATAQATLARTLIEASQRLAPDLERIFLVAVGITRLEQDLGLRLAELSKETELSVRTLYRRLSEAEKGVAAQLERLTLDNLDDNPFAVRGWYVERLESDAYLAGQRPVFVGDREIRATHDGLRIICESFSIPRYSTSEGDPEPLVTGQAGCDAVTLTRYSPSTWLIRVELDRTLNTGDVHRVALAITMPSRAAVLPFNVTVPVRRIKSFVARVHYEPGQLRDAWAIDGVPPISMDERGRTAMKLAIDASLERRWSVVRRGLAYGIGWEWQDAP
jgi:hypothetical protein